MSSDWLYNSSSSPALEHYLKTKAGGGAPLVWFSETNFLTTTQIIWTEEYEAYISGQQIVANTVIESSTQAAIDLKQTMNVDAAGNVNVISEGTKSAISIYNQGDEQWTCGISQKQSGGNFSPMCAIPLHGHMLDEIVPIEKVLFMFASNTVFTSTVIYKALSDGLIIDLTSNQTRSVKFDINKSWDCNNQAWGQSVVANADLVPLLLVSD